VAVWGFMLDAPGAEIGTTAQLNESEIKEQSTTLVKGEYHPAGPKVLRCPCPLVNALANHGYIPHNGRNVLVEDFYAGVKLIGFTPTVAASLTYPIYNEMTATNTEDRNDLAWRDLSWLSYVQAGYGLLINVWNPWSMLSTFALRNKGQVDAMGQTVMNLDQIGTHRIIEHDISLTRRDVGEGDATTPQEDLVADLLASSLDDEMLTASDLAALRKLRIAHRRAEYPQCQYNRKEHTSLRENSNGSRYLWRWQERSYFLCSGIVPRGAATCRGRMAETQRVVVHGRC
jgi:hypothetical protein